MSSLRFCIVEIEINNSHIDQQTSLTSQANTLTFSARKFAAASSATSDLLTIQHTSDTYDTNSVISAAFEPTTATTAKHKCAHNDCMPSKCASRASNSTIVDCGTIQLGTTVVHCSDTNAANVCRWSCDNTYTKSKRLCSFECRPFTRTKSTAGSSAAKTWRIAENHYAATRRAEASIGAAIHRTLWHYSIDCAGAICDDNRTRADKRAEQWGKPMYEHIIAHGALNVLWADTTSACSNGSTPAVSATAVIVIESPAAATAWFNAKSTANSTTKLHRN